MTQRTVEPDKAEEDVIFCDACGKSCTAAQFVTSAHLIRDLMLLCRDCAAIERDKVAAGTKDTLYCEVCETHRRAGEFLLLAYPDGSTTVWCRGCASDEHGRKHLKETGATAYVVGSRVHSLPRTADTKMP